MGVSKRVRAQQVRAAAEARDKMRKQQRETDKSPKRNNGKCKRP